MVTEGYAEEVAKCVKRFRWADSARYRAPGSREGAFEWFGRLKSINTAGSADTLAVEGGIVGDECEAMKPRLP